MKNKSTRLAASLTRMLALRACANKSDDQLSTSVVLQKIAKTVSNFQPNTPLHAPASPISGQPNHKIVSTHTTAPLLPRKNLPTRMACITRDRKIFLQMVSSRLPQALRYR